MLRAWYDALNAWVQFDVWVMPYSWLGIGFGSSMQGSDIAWWSANGTSSLMTDMYSADEAILTTDPINTYTTKFSVLSDGTVNFKSTRLLDPG